MLRYTYIACLGVHKLYDFASQGFTEGTSDIYETFKNYGHPKLLFKDPVRLAQ